MSSSLKVILFVSYKKALSVLASADKHSTLAPEAMLTRDSKSSFFDSSMYQSAEHPAFCGRVLHIIVQTAKTRVSLLLFGRFPRNLVGLEDPICNPFV